MCSLQLHLYIQTSSGGCANYGQGLCQLCSGGFANYVRGAVPIMFGGLCHLELPLKFVVVVGGCVYTYYSVQRGPQAEQQFLFIYGYPCQIEVPGPKMLKFH